MSKYNIRKLQLKHRKVVLNEFYKAVATLKNLKEAEKFFTDLLDLTEIAMLSRRLIAAEKLYQGKTFDEIAKELKMGKDTIAKVSHWFHEGQGYKLIVARLKGKKKIKNNSV